MATFAGRVVVDENGQPLAGAVGKIYDIDDTGNTTPLAVNDIGGTPYPLNEIVANNDGVTDEFTTNDNRIVVKWVSGLYEQLMIAIDQLPTGGTIGQVLQKVSATDYDAEWSDPLGVPPGGLTGQQLVKASGTDFDTTWASASSTANSVMSYGAVGDGVTDDTAAIQDALDVGGAIYFPMGDYLITSTLRVQLGGTSLIGEGSGNRLGGLQVGVGTRIRLGSTFSGTEMILVQPAANDKPLTHVHISGMTLDGNNLPGPIDGIVFRASQSSIKYVDIWNCSGNGLRVRGYASPNWDTYDDMFHNMLIGDCGLAGVYMDNNSPDLHFSHCVFLDNRDNMELAGGGSSQQVTGCHFYGATRYNIFFNGAGSRSKFSNCKIEGAGQHGVLIDSTNGGYSDIQFTGCGFSSPMQTSATNSWDLLHITGPTSAGIGRTTIVGCSFGLKGGLTVKPRFGINLATSAAQGTVIVGNSFGLAGQFGSAPLNNASNSTILQYIRSNAGCPDVILPIVISTSLTINPDHVLGAPIEMNAAGAVTLTIPANAQPGFFKGNVIEVVQTGTGQVTFAAGSGVTLRTPRSFTTRTQYSTVRARQTAANQWILEGDLT